MSNGTEWRITTGRQDPATVARLLRSLPHWFGFEESNAAYVESARELPTYLAWPAGADEPAGVLLAFRHFPQSAEIYLLAVDPVRHRQGAGRALIDALEADLAADGVQFLQVKTLGPSNPDEGYAKTRRFYLGLDFQPLEELKGHWGGDQHCLIMIKAVGGRV
jgi:ribosomal protein S18 acetylase RimI-like enzyme